MNPLDPSERGVCFRKVVINLEGPDNCRFSLGQQFPWVALGAACHVRVRQTRVAERKVRIFCNGSLEVLYGSVESRLSPLTEKNEAPQVQIVNFRAIRIASG